MKPRLTNRLFNVIFSVQVAHGLMNFSCNADVLAAQYNSQTSFNYKISHMPDLDQRRSATSGIAGLPGNGSFYCVPSSCMNALAYIAQHGYSEVPPGPANWQAQSQYGTATAHIALLGNLSNTNSTSGTDYANAVTGMKAYVGGWAGILTFQTFFSNSFWAPRIQDVASQATQGKLVCFSYGRYNYNGTSNGTVLVGSRANGHSVTLATAQRSGDSILIGVRDPADDPDSETNSDWRFGQSPFSTRIFNQVQQRLVSGPGFQRNMTVMIFPPVPPSGGGQTRVALMDKMLTIGLKYGLTFENTIVPTLKQMAPAHFTGFPSPFEEKVWELAQGTIRDAIMNADDSHFAYVLAPTAGSSQVAMLNPADGTTTPLLTSELAPYRVVFGRKRELYVLTFPIPDVVTSKILCLNADSGIVNNITATKTLGPWCAAIAYHDATDKVLVLDTPNRMIYKISAGLPVGEGLPGQAIPSNIPLHQSLGSLAVNPVDGRIWFATPASPRVFTIEPGLPTVVHDVPFVGVQTITSIDFDDAGHMFVMADGQIRELQKSGPNPDQWSAVPNSYFAGFNAGDRLALSRSRTNYDPAIHVPTQWLNIHPDELLDFAPGMVLIDCNADIDGDRVVDIDDLLQVIGNWGAPPPHPANIDDIGLVDINDLLLVISSWGDCPD